MSSVLYFLTNTEPQGFFRTLHLNIIKHWDKVLFKQPAEKRDKEICSKTHAPDLIFNVVDRLNYIDS